MEKLKPCPFCGSEAEIVDCEDDPRWFVRCKKEHCVEQRSLWMTKSEAVNKWNKREKGEDAMRRWKKAKRGEDAPTIDPVKHGKWLNTSTDIPNLLMNVCSECGFQYPSAIRPRFNYCPNCGARMESEE